MKRRLHWIGLAAVLATAASAQELVLTRAELRAEMAEKLQRVRRMLAQRNLAGVVISQVRNVSWLTAGMMDSHVVITSEQGPASLVVLRDGRRFALASGSEMPRLMSEDLAGLGFQPLSYRWYEDAGPDSVKGKHLRGLGPLGTDAALWDHPNVDGEIAKLRHPLTSLEIRKYRWLGRQATEAVESVCRRVAPGNTERQIEAWTSDELMRRGIRPTVLLIGTDDRIMKFRHAVPSDHARLARYGMVNICARRWGLVVALTRFVHFGPVPRTLAAKLRAAATVNAALLAASRPGITSERLLEVAKLAYRSVGWPDEWKEHHQGGPIAYGEREWVAFPGSKEVVADRMAFAWNPTVQGAKVEDTVLVDGGRVEDLTSTPDWPTLTVHRDGLTFRAPDILVREAR